MRLIVAFLILFSFPCIHAQKHVPKFTASHDKYFLDSLLKTNPALAPILSKRDLNIQVIYTKIDRDTKNSPHFTDYTFQLNRNRYFYPASTVKMPVAFLALEKLNEMNHKGVNKLTTMVTDSASEKQQIVYTAPSAENSVPSIAHYIKQVFLVSDNEAYNRLYEFLGQGYIRKELKKKGYPDALIRHRLQTPLTNEQNRITNPIAFYDTSGNKLYEQEQQYNEAITPNLEVRLGKGYYRGSTLINEPFDFSYKNRVFLQDLHGMLRSVLFPEAVGSKQHFNLTKDDYSFLLKWLSGYPKESKYPYYDSTNYWDAYCKFILFGSEKKEVPKHIRIFNKPGDAYGFLTDIAYVVDFKNNIEFMLSATISCNSDGIYNDDKYDYETIGFPFMKQVGQTIYDYELKRERKQQPDLTKFNLNYLQQ